ncbi:MAG TPA: hypothetical protein VGO05_04485, partial [Roseiarcus sp.]|nr:hypothetical protein [Roseiarcus sp.]
TIGQRHDEISVSGLEDGVSKALKISVEERQLRLPSGNQTLFANRLKLGQVLFVEGGAYRASPTWLLSRYRPRPRASR